MTDKWIHLCCPVGVVRVRASSVVGYHGRSVIIPPSRFSKPSPGEKHQVIVYVGPGKDDGLIENHPTAESVAARIAEFDAFFNPKESG